MQKRYNLPVNYQLNDQQKKAVEHTDGPLLVFAGAGSGKTRVITYRIANLIHKGASDPENILAITFTRKAASEMKQRVKKILSNLSEKEIKFRGRLPWIGTFHSFGAHILHKDGKHVGISPGYSIYDPNDAISLIKSIMEEMNIDKKQFQPKSIFNTISSAKNEMITADEYPRFAQGPFQEIVAEIYPEYQMLLREQNAVDFDDLQIEPLKLLEEFPEIQEKYNQQFKYVLVDEYQDTNTVQYRLVKKLAGDHENICVVGDDDQGIYAWRGASIKNILSFERDFKGCKVVKLEKNYRSTKNILHSAYAVVSKNNERVDKELWTDAGEGEKIVVYEARNEKDEAKFIIAEIKQLKREGVSLDEVVILYRTNAQSRVLEEELLRNALAYRLVGGVRFYERREIKDLLAYLRFFANPLDDLSFQRIINVPPRRIGKKSLEEIKTISEKYCGDELGIGAFILVLWGHAGGVKNWSEYLPTIDIPKNLFEALDKGYLKDFSEEYSELISLFGKLYELSMLVNVRELITEILDETKYVDWIDDGTPQAQERKENIFEFKVISEKFIDQGPRDSLIEFLADVALVEQDQEVDIEEDGEAVTLMTLHSAKGLEFDNVFISGMEEGLFPHSLSFSSPSELEEERRLCYVGITRARKRLFLSFAENRKTYNGITDRIPSRFVSELPMELVDFQSWSR